MKYNYLKLPTLILLSCLFTQSSFSGLLPKGLLPTGKLVRLGNEAMARGDYDTAIELYADYKKQKPEDEKINGKLTAAKKAAVNHRYKMAQKAFNNFYYDEAAAWIKGAKDIAPNKEGPISMEEVLAEKEEVDSKVKKAQSLALNGDLKDALSLFERLRNFESILPNLEKDIVRVKRGLSDNTLKDIQLLLSKDKYEEANQRIESARKFWKLNPVISDSLTTMDEKKDVKKINESILSLLRKNKYPEAYSLGVRASSIQPKNSKQQQILAKVQEKWANFLYNKASRASLTGGKTNLETALTDLGDAEILNPELPSLEDKQNETKQALAEILYAQASAWADNEKRLGHRLINLIRVSNLVPKYPGINQEVTETLKALKARRQYFVSIKTTDLPGGEGDGFAPLLNQELLSALRDAAIPDLNIVHREDLETKTQEQVYSQIFGGNFELDLKPANIQVALKVLDKSANKRGYNKPRSMTSEYLAGTRMVSNPEFGYAQAAVSNARAEYQRALQANQQAQQDLQRQQAAANNPYATQATRQAAALSALGSTLGGVNVGSAQRNLNNAESTLAITPPQIEEEIVKPYTYKEYSVSCDTKVKIAYQVIDNETSLFKDAGTVEASDTASDKFTVGIKAEDRRNLFEDSDTLPDQDILLEKSKSSCSKKLQTKLIETFKNYAEKYYKQAKEAVRINDTDSSIEHSIDYLYSVYSLKQDKAFEIDALLEKHMNFSFKHGMLIPKAKKRLGLELKPAGANEPHQGLFITAINQNQPAAKANLKAGDLLQAIDLLPLKDAYALSDYIDALRPKQSPVLTVLRNGRRIYVPLVL